MSERHSRGKNSEATYEHSDVSIRGIVLFTIGLIVATAIVMWLMAWLFLDFEDRAATAEAAEIPRTRVTDARPEHPPEPVLQGAPGSRFELQDPVVEMEDWRRQEREMMEQTGWIDRNEGTVRIPVERAKALLLERGLPVRERAAAGGPES